MGSLFCTVSSSEEGSGFDPGSELPDSFSLPLRRFPKQAHQLDKRVCEFKLRFPADE